MKLRNHRIWRPDPLLLLAVLVGFGVLVTTAAQAGPRDDEKPDGMQETGRALMLQPVQGLAERLNLHWLNTTLERPAVRQVLARKRLGMGRPFGEKGPELGFSWRPRIRNTASASGDSGIGAVSTERPDLYFSLRRSW